MQMPDDDSIVLFECAPIEDLPPGSHVGWLNINGESVPVTMTVDDDGTAVIVRRSVD